MRILVVNDDGIKAPGIKRLVQMAAGLGAVPCHTGSLCVAI